MRHRLLVPSQSHATGPAPSASVQLNAFTVDVEDYFQVSAFEQDIDRKRWHTFPSRVVDNTLRLLETLADHNVVGTFFVIGWIAERYPHLVTEIHAAGHEIGSHSHLHRLLYQLTPDEFRKDLIRSRHALENILGEPIRIFRAPSFSITERSLWAMEILVEEGFTIDSSVFPVYHDRYGMPNANPAIHRWRTPSGSLWECPPAVVRIAGLNLPVSGGGYFRLYPGALSRRLLRTVNQTAGRPFVFYIHPWEIDPQQPRLGVGSRLSRWRHYLNLDTTERKLEQLLQSFRFGKLSDVVASVDPSNSRDVAQRAIALTPVDRPA